MLALTAIAVLAPLLYIPGYLLERAMRAAVATPDLLERHYERVVLGALLNGWLALTLAELGVFAAWLHLLIVALLCVGAGLVALRRGGVRVEPPVLSIVARPVDSGRRAGGARSLAQAAAWAARNWPLLAFAALGVLFLMLVARPFEVVLGGRDAGFYANTGFGIAHHGDIWQHDPIVAQIGADKHASDAALATAAAQAETNFLLRQDPTRYLLTGIRATGFFFDRDQIAQGQIISQGFHLFPAWIGLFTSLLGMQGGLLATGLMGLLGVWSVGMLGRRLAGNAVGLLGALLLALNGAQVWFSRYSTTETTAQFLAFAGLYAFVVMQAGAERRAQSAEQEEPIAPSPWHGLLAGLAFGQWALVRIEFLLVIGPVGAFLFYTWLTKRWARASTVLLAALAAMLIQAALHVTFFARGYFFDTLFARLQDKSAIVAALTLPFLSPALHTIYLTTPRSLINYWAANPADRHSPLRLVFEVVALLLALVGLVLLRRWQAPLHQFERVLQHAARWLVTASALALVLVLAYAYLVRPQILTRDVLKAAPGCLAPVQLRQPSGPCLALQGYIGAPVTPPEHPDAIAYTFDTLLKLPRQPRLSAAATVALAQATALRDLPTLDGQPSPGALLDQLDAGSRAQVLGKSADGLSYLVRNMRGVTGWIDTVTLPLDQATAKRLPEQPDKILAKIVNPRWAMTLSPTNPSEAKKFAIYQASMVRFGWYLSPLGIVLAVVGLALLWMQRRRSAWLLLVVGGLATYVFLEQAYGTDEATYIYLLRRFVPQVYPLFCLSAAYALVALARRWTVDGGRWNLVCTVYRLPSIVLTLSLIGFLAATNLKLYRHTEYAGALDQLGAVAAKFTPTDVLLFRGGAPTWAEFRDTPDNVATPLTYAFDRNALTIKSKEPGNYAQDLARYIRRWQDQGRSVYLIEGASGAVGLPGLRAEPAGRFTLALDEFEQLTDQKPSNVQKLTADYAVYKLAPGAPMLPAAVTPTDYQVQVRGFYRAEQLAGETLAWTNGDALLRLPWPRDGKPFTLAVTLAPGQRPATLGPVQAHFSYRPEPDYWVENPQAAPFRPIASVQLRANTQRYTIQIDPRGVPAPPTGSFLLRIASATWVPAQADQRSLDQRRVGVLFGGAAVGGP